MLPWLLCGGLALAALVVWVRLHLLQKSLDEISKQLGERLVQDTNNLIFLSSQDPSARRLAAELNVQLNELRRQRQQYETGDRELKQAVTNISHDLRTPLTAVSGYLELLERRSLDADTARYLACIRERTGAMTRLTEELLRYSVALAAEAELHLEPVDLNGALEESLAGFYAAFTARGVMPSVSMPEERVVRILDRSALDRVLGNLLNNALKYSGGDLEIRLTRDGTLLFRNTAPNLDEVQAGKLFDRFYTVETARNSTGLGLSIAKTLTERMGGTIRAQYEAGVLQISVRFGPSG